jgi:glycosyltransferase involved in cell wall biosynthesis
MLEADMRHDAGLPVGDLPLKILIVHNYYRQAGGERAAVEAQQELLSSRGHDVILYSRDNGEIERYGVMQKLWFFVQTVSSTRTRREIQDLIQRERPDLVHVHNVFPLISPSAYRAVKETGLPIVQTVHNYRFMCPNALFYTHDRVCERCKHGRTWHAARWKCYRQSYPLSALYALAIGLHRRWRTFECIDRFITLAPFASQKLVEGGIAREDRITVLGNPLLDPLPATGSTGESESYIIYLGRLSPEKGVHVLLRALAEAPGLPLKVLGEGPQAEDLQAMARQQGLDQVEFLGRVDGERKWQLLRGAFALVVPSLCYETFGLSALEGLCVGTPVVASDLGSLPQLVEDGKSGLLFPPGDATALRDRLDWLAANPQRGQEMGQHGRRIVETRYRAQVYYEGLMDVYSEVLH